MVSRIACHLFLMTGLFANAEVDLTPTIHESDLEGVRLKGLAFHNGDKVITYTPPPGWRLSGGGLKLRLLPEIPMADGVIEVRTKSASTAFDDDAVKKLKQEILATLPKEITDVSWDPDEANPLMINRHDTYRVTLAYSVYGQRFKLSVLTCNFAKQQLRFSVSTREPEFQKLAGEFTASLYSWEGLE